MSLDVFRRTQMYSDVLIYPLCPRSNYSFKVNTYGLGTTVLLLWRFLWGGNGYSLTSGGCGLSLVVDGLEPTFYSENFCPTTPSLCSGRLCISHQVLMAMFAKVRRNFCSLQKLTQQEVDFRIVTRILHKHHWYAYGTFFRTSGILLFGFRVIFCEVPLYMKVGVVYYSNWIFYGKFLSGLMEFWSFVVLFQVLTVMFAKVGWNLCNLYKGLGRIILCRPWRTNKSLDNTTVWYSISIVSVI